MNIVLFLNISVFSSWFVFRVIIVMLFSMEEQWANLLTGGPRWDLKF